MSTVRDQQIERLIRGEESHPFGTLGPHKEIVNGQTRTVIRTFLPDVATVTILFDDADKTVLPMQPTSQDGLFEATCPFDAGVTEYRLLIEDRFGTTTECRDPYACGFVLSDYDLHLFGEGKLYKAYDKLGAQVCRHKGVKGVSFVVWAPNAKRVSVVGNFNVWGWTSTPDAIARGLWSMGTLYPGLTRR